jgi:hypothetical protein
MGRPAIQSFSPTKDIDVYECHPDGERQFQHWRLWDKRAEYNIVMDAKTKEEALVKAIEYWAEKYKELKTEHDELQTKVYAFINAVAPPQENDHDD